MTEEKSILDKAKDLATDIKDKAVEIVKDNEEKIHGAVDKTGEFIDEKVTKRKFTEKIGKGKEATKDAVSKVAHSGDEKPEGEAGGDAPASGESSTSES
jgi:hypothetical protein